MKIDRRWWREVAGDKRGVLGSAMTSLQRCESKRPLPLMTVRCPHHCCPWLVPRPAAAQPPHTGRCNSPGRAWQPSLGRPVLQISQGISQGSRQGHAGSRYSSPAAASRDNYIIIAGRGAVLGRGHLITGAQLGPPAAQQPDPG